MPITFNCPHCGHSTQAADQFAGKTGPCASCGGQITIPLPAGKPSFGPPRKAPSSSSGGAKIVVVIMAVLGITVVCGGSLAALLAALLLPAVQQAREAARRMSCSNNMKQIALAMHNYHDTYKTFPPAYIPAEDGSPMHSWRTLILPFTEQQPLHDRYNFHVPWDAPENQFALDVAIQSYACPSDPVSTGAATNTSYLLITGTGTIFDLTKSGKIAEITDGTSNTIMAVEVRGSGIKWSQPLDMDIEAFVGMFGPNGAGKGMSPHSGGLNVALADGSVRFLSFALSQQDVRALATSAAGDTAPSLY